MDNRQIVTVSALTKYLKYKFENDKHIRNFQLKGEISNLKYHNHGHIYFSLKDNFAKISALMFSTDASRLSFTLSEGMEVIVTGSVNIFEVNGTYQIYVKEIEQSGTGKLLEQFNLLKQQFEETGYFNENRKVKIPRVVKTIGIVTAQEGAAITDFASSISKHIPHVNAILYPSLVQGGKAPEKIAQAIAKANVENKVEVLIVGRGGGSLEDLWAFNTKEVVEAIFQSQIPIISAVGHEIDHSLSDYVADYRAQTPTAAIYYFDSKRELESRLEEARMLASMAFSQKINQMNANVNIQSQRVISVSPQNKLTKNFSRWENLSLRLNNQSLNRKIESHFDSTEHAITRMQNLLDVITVQKQSQFEQKCAELILLNPLAQLSRGFAIVYEKDKVITSKDMIKNDDLRIVFANDEINVKVVK